MGEREGTGITRRRFLSWGLRAAVPLMMGKGFYNTTRHSVVLDRADVRIAGLAPGLAGLRMAVIADLHVSPVVSEGLVLRAAELAMRHKPDVIVLVGDMISGAFELFTDTGHFRLDRAYLDRLTRGLGALSAPLGIHAVTGNHEHWYGPEGVSAITAALTAALGVRWLRNSHTLMERGGGTLVLAGVDDYWSPACRPARALEGAPEGAPVVMLSHNPDVNLALRGIRRQVDLVVSGHTHGGQVVIPGLGAPVTTSAMGQRYLAGLVRADGRQTYVTRGAGHLMVPLRFNCPPEVGLLTLVPA